MRYNKKLSPDERLKRDIKNARYNITRQEKRIKQGKPVKIPPIFWYYEMKALIKKLS